MVMSEGAAPTIDYEQIIANQRASAKKHIEGERRRQANRLAIGRWATIRRLQVSKDLNGLSGIIIQEINEGGRIGVRLEGRGDKLVKERNMDAFPDEAVVKLARYGADGERGATCGVRTWFWPRMILERAPHEVSPVSKLIGIDLCVSKVSPLHEKFADRAKYDNEWATFLMIDPLMYGFAPDRWQAFVGPVVVWRASLEPFSSDDASLLHDFLTDLLDKYAQGQVRVSRDITPAAFQRSKERSLRFEEMNSEDVQQSVDVNI